MMNEAKLNLRLTTALLEAAKLEAERRGLTLSDWIRGLIAEATGGPLLRSRWQRKRKPRGGRR
jgi:predicted DNA binding CopG/RHH family protein